MTDLVPQQTPLLAAWNSLHWAKGSVAGACLARARRHLSLEWRRWKPVSNWLRLLSPLLSHVEVEGELAEFGAAKPISARWVYDDPVTAAQLFPDQQRHNNSDAQSAPS